MTTDQDSQTNDLWKPFRHFLGSWAGTGTGEPGASSVERTYALTLAGRFIAVRNRVDTKLTFVTEAIENTAPGWRARHTLEILSPDSFRETFDLAAPGKPWACYVTNEFHRAF
jgi:hypothetical protein